MRDLTYWPDQYGKCQYDQSSRRVGCDVWYAPCQTLQARNIWAWDLHHVVIEVSRRQIVGSCHAVAGRRPWTSGCRWSCGGSFALGWSASWYHAVPNPL